MTKTISKITACLLGLSLLIQTAGPMEAFAYTASGKAAAVSLDAVEVTETSGTARRGTEKASVNDEFVAEVVTDPEENASPEAAEDLPRMWLSLQGAGEGDSYDGRAYQTPVKNQGSYNTCWAFSVTGAAEASMISQGLEDTSVDYSEHGLAYFMYNSPANDPLGNTAGDKNVLPEGETYYGAGGNPVYALMMLSGWKGMQDEALIPYEEIGSEASYEDGDCYTNEAVLRQGFIYNIQSNPELVKEAIREYGAATIEYKNSHSMLIVGWDDDYPKENFGVPTGSPSELGDLPEKDGAWLVKNSYGTAGDEGGYLWISYEDKEIGTSSVAMEFMPADTYDHNFHYDGTAGSRTNVYESSGKGTLAPGGSAANHFKNNSGSPQLLEAVSLGVKTANVKYQVQIYTKKGMMTGPEDSNATPAFEEPVEGTTTASGIYCVELPEPVYIDKAAEFSVVVTVRHESEEKNTRGEAIQLFTDKAINMTSGGKTVLKFVNSTKTGQSYVRTFPLDPKSTDPKKGWADWAKTEAASSSWTFRIKAFTSDTEERKEEDPEEKIRPEKIYFDPEEEDVTITVGKQRRMVLKYKPTDRSMEGLTFDWESDDPDVATVSSSGGKAEAIVKAKTEGSCFIYATCRQRPQLTARCYVETEKSQGGGGSGGGSGGGGGNPLGPGAVAKPASNAAYSARWYTGSDGCWYLKGKNGQPVTSVWVCDDTNAATRGNVWYLVSESGKMESSPLVQDASGNYYSLEMRHDGYFGMLRYQNGTYDLGNGKTVYLEFEQSHNGSFGAIRNKEGIDALMAQYGVSRFPVSDTQFLYTSSLDQ